MNAPFLFINFYMLNEHSTQKFERMGWGKFNLLSILLTRFLTLGLENL